MRDTGKYGKGVFAKELIEKGELLCIFGGYIMTVEEEMALPDDLNDLGVAIHGDFVIGIKHPEEAEDADYFNHSCDPNAGFKGQIFLEAMENIGGGVEVTFDYAMVISGNKRPNYKIYCECGASNCRRVITCDDWKIPELQHRYNGYFQYYLQYKIDKIKT